MLVFGCIYIFPQFTQRLKTGILNVALGWTFQFFPVSPPNKPCLVKDILVDQSMLFTDY